MENCKTCLQPLPDNRIDAIPLNRDERFEPHWLFAHLFDEHGNVVERHVKRV